MKIKFDRRRLPTEADQKAAALIAEGFKRLRAQQVSNASAGSPGVTDSTSVTHVCDAQSESNESNNGG